MDKVTFIADDGSKEEFFVEEQTRINGTTYLLVSDSDGDEANAYIMKEIAGDLEQEGTYVMVEDEVEWDAVSKVFASMLEEDVEITLEED